MVARVQGSVLGAPVSGAQISGKISLGVGKNSRPGEFAHGQLWTWDVPLEGIETEGFALAGAMQGSLKFSLHDDGSITGETDAGAQKLLLKSQRLATPINLGDYSLHAGFDITAGKYAVTQIVLRRVDAAVLSGETELLGPQSEKPELGIHVGGFHFDAAAAKQTLLSVRHLPADLVDMLNRLSPGKVTVGDVTLSAALDEIKTAPLDAIRKNLVVSGDHRGRRIHNSNGYETAAGRKSECPAWLLERLAHDLARHREVWKLCDPRPRRQRQPRQRNRGRGL